MFYLSLLEGYKLLRSTHVRKLRYSVSLILCEL